VTDRDIPSTVRSGPHHEMDELTDRPLRVLMATRRPQHEHGGVERVVRDITKEIRRQQPTWNVDVVSAFESANRIEGLDGVSDVIAALRLGWRVAKSNADVVFIHCPECVWGLRLFSRRGKTPLVVVWHGAGPKPYLVLRNHGNIFARALASFRTFEERRALRADGQIAVHEVVADDLRSIYGHTGVVTVIQNALDPETMAQLSRPRSTEPRPPFTAVWVGQAGHRKGLDVALAAIEIAQRQVPDLRLIVGGVPRGPAKLGVEWLGVVEPDDIPDVYRRADVLLFPTRYESFGLVVVEAMAAGLPVVISDAVPAGIVTQAVNGFIVSGHDPADYAEVLVALQRDDALRTTIGDVNREEAQRFSVESAGTEYAAVAIRCSARRPIDDPAYSP
jgi:glycosyltransferase involved in cell wall biosynthesis